MNSSEAAEQIVKFSIEGIEMALRLSGTGLERIAVMLYTMSKDNKMTKGKTTLNKMLKSGSPLQIFSIKASELEKFGKEAKKYGILYTALIDKKAPDNDGIVDIMVRSEDAAKINRVVERFKLAQIDNVSIRSEIEKDKIEEMLKDAKDRGVPIADEAKLANDILSKPIQKEENTNSNPEVAKTQSPLSEPVLENSKGKDGVVKEKKPSVRKLLNKLKEEVKNRDSNEDKVKENTKQKSNSKDTISKDKTSNTKIKKNKRKER